MTETNLWLYATILFIMLIYKHRNKRNGAMWGSFLLCHLFWDTVSITDISNYTVLCDSNYKIGRIWEEMGVANVYIISS
jgi:hypothetical protein